MDTLGSVVSSIAGTALSGPVKDYNTFMGTITNAIQDPFNSIGDVASMFGVRNPYAQQNTLQVLQNRGEPVLSFEWLAAIIDPNPTSTLPWYYIDTIQTPGLQLAQHDQYFNGLTKKFASSLTVDSLELGLFTDQNAATFNFADAWFNSTYRTDGYFSLASKYKKDVILFILDQYRKTVIDIRFIGCWPASYPGYQLDSQNNVVETRLSLSVDRVKFNTESSLTRAVDRFRSQWPGILADAGSNLFNFPPRR